LIKTNLLQLSYAITITNEGISAWQTIVHWFQYYQHWWISINLFNQADTDSNGKYGLWDSATKITIWPSSFMMPNLVAQVLTVMAWIWGVQNYKPTSWLGGEFDPIKIFHRAWHIVVHKTVPEPRCYHGLNFRQKILLHWETSCQGWARPTIKTNHVWQEVSLKLV